MLETTTNFPNTKAERIQPALLQVSMVQGNDNDMLRPRAGGGDGGGGGERVVVVVYCLKSIST